MRRKRKQQDFNAEIESHLQLEADQLRSEGTSDEAQVAATRIGEWREDRTANSVGLYHVFEDLGDGMIRHHIAHNLAPQNRLYL